MGDNPYPFPSDAAEETRLDSVQDMIMILYGAQVLVPIRNLPNTEIVDLGTGSGTIRLFLCKMADLGKADGLLK
jgi:hypothetical protein